MARSSNGERLNKGIRDAQDGKGEMPSDDVINGYLFNAEQVANGTIEQPQRVVDKTKGNINRILRVLPSEPDQS